MRGIRVASLQIRGDVLELHAFLRQRLYVHQVGSHLLAGLTIVHGRLDLVEGILCRQKIRLMRIQHEGSEQYAVQA